MQCVDTNRDLFGFLKRERIQILRMAKERLDKVAKEADDDKTGEIQNKLNDINSQVRLNIFYGNMWNRLSG